MKKFLFLLIVTPLIFTGCIEDPCATVICLNGGEDVTQGDECFCECPAGFEGANCQNEIMANPCETVVCANDGICIDGTCDCPEGFSGDNCEIVDPCLEVVCANGVFVITDGVCACECNDGFTGDDCNTEIEANFIAAWDAKDMCEIFYGNEPIPYVATVLENSMMDGYQILNFAAFDATLAFTANIDGNTISVPLSEIMTEDGNYLIEGSGVLSDDGNTITWTYTTDLAGQIDNCTGVWTRVP